jgi:7,8-dihydroneopterin aldolase/epimerase/oxygenase
MKDLILIEDLEVHYRVGVPASERAEPQRLLLCVELVHDFTEAAASDDLHRTLDYYAVTRRLLEYGQGRSWRLIETLAVQIAELVLEEFQAATVRVTVKKFILPETRYVAVHVERSRREPPNS